MGHLIVFEGPDGVGKSTVADRLERWLSDQGLPTSRYAFPGKRAGTLGKLIYDVHHGAEYLTVEVRTELALQILHIAAHVETIESDIKPAIHDKDHLVLLDRYWWSTRVYGAVRGAPERVLHKAIEVERNVWGATAPSALFLLRRNSERTSSESAEKPRDRLAERYERIADAEQRQYPVYSIDNSGDLKDTVGEIKERLGNENII